MQPTTPHNPDPAAPAQLSLALPADPAPLVAKAQRLFRRSALMQRRWPSFEAAMDDPLMGQCLRVAAKGLLRNEELNNRKKGQRREVR